MNLSAWLLGMFDWRVVWLSSAIFSLAVIGVVLVFLGGDVGCRAGEGPSQCMLQWNRPSRSALSRFLAIGMATFLFFLMASNSVQAYYPLYLITERSLHVEGASFIASLLDLAPIFVCPVIGVAVDRMRSPSPIIVSGVLLTCALTPLLFAAAEPIVLCAMAVAVSFGGPMFSVPMRSIVSDLTESQPELTGIGMAVLTFSQGLSNFVGPLFLGMGIRQLGWVGALIGLVVPASALSLIIVVFLARDR